MSVTIIVLLSVIAAIVFGVLVTVTVEVGRAHGRRMAGSVTSVGGAQRLRSTLRAEMGQTRQVVDQAAAHGAPVGELQRVVTELVGHAEQLDRLLATGGVSPELRDRHHRLVTACRTIRGDLTDVELLRSWIPLNDTLSRAQLEIEALRADRGFLGQNPKDG